MDIVLKQASHYELAFPLTHQGQAIPDSDITGVLFSVFAGATEKLRMTLSAGASFANSEVKVFIDNEDSIVLGGIYEYELWIVDAADNPKWVNGGDITFDKTKARV